MFIFMFPVFHLNRAGRKYQDKVNYVAIFCIVVYEKASFSACPVKVYSFCNYDEIKTVLIVNGVR